MHLDLLTPTGNSFTRQSLKTLVWGRYLSILGQFINVFKGGARLRTQLIFTHQIATMIGAGIPLLTGLKILGVNGVGRKLNEILGPVISALEEGQNLSEALGQHPDIFDKFYLGLIQLSEFTGKLDLILSQLINYLDSSLRLRSNLIIALIYPSVIIVTTLLVSIGLLVFIVPTFRDLFYEVGAELPLSTRCIITLGDFCRTHFLIITAGILLGMMGVLCLGTTLSGRDALLRYVLKLPLFGPLIKKIFAARLSRNLSIVLSSGGSIVEGLRISISSIQFPDAQSISVKCVDDIGEGRSLSEALGQITFLSPICLQMIAVGERSGSSDMIFNKLAEMYEKDIENCLSLLKQLIEPLMILFLAVFVGAIVFAMYAPIFSLGGIMGR